MPARLAPGPRLFLVDARSRQIPELAALLADPERVQDVPPDAVPALLAQLAALQIGLAARLAVRRPVEAPSVPPDELLDVLQAATLIRRSPSWLRRNGHTLPGFSQPRGKGTATRWSRNALEAWALGNDQQ